MRFVLKNKKKVLQMAKTKGECNEIGGLQESIHGST
jgi:hypothetical protein